MVKSEVNKDYRLQSVQKCKVVNVFFLFFFLQGPLEKSLQNSVAFERQKNMDNRVGIIRGSVQVTQTPSIQDGENTKLNFIDEFYTKKMCFQLMDQAVKYIEDMQDDFDFRYKTLQSRGEPFYKL